MTVATKEHDGAWFTRVWLDESNQLICQYEVLEVYGWDGRDDVPLFQKKGSDFNDHITTADHGDAHILIHGSIKWDGCSHNYFVGEEEGGYFHACGRGSLVALGGVFAHIYDEAQRIFAAAGQHHEGLE